MAQAEISSSENKLSNSNHGYSPCFDEPKEMALEARQESRKLQRMCQLERSKILSAVADIIFSHSEEVSAANAIDLAAAEMNKTDLQLVSQLKLSPSKLDT